MYDSKNLIIYIYIKNHSPILRNKTQMLCTIQKDNTANTN